MKGGMAKAKAVGVRGEERDGKRVAITSALRLWAGHTCVILKLIWCTLNIRQSIRATYNLVIVH